jgi:cell fate (sporulation/competence/biofilm development) regulator YlbF (YheA/YmcA/DUF963 family)
MKYTISEQELVKLVKKIIKEDSDRSELFNDYSEIIDAIERAFYNGEYEDNQEMFDDEVRNLIEQIYDNEDLNDEEVDHLLFMAEDLFTLWEN